MIVTVDRLRKAIENKLGFDARGAEETALRILNYFGYSNTIIDNSIDQEDRKLFYQLHDAGLLNTWWETVILASGRAWRTFYWELDKDAIERAAEEREKRGAELPYESLPEEVWIRAGE